MNKLDAAKFLPILKAYSEGKTIQVFLSHRKEWVDNKTELSFVLKVDNYRIKPETVKYKRYLMKDTIGKSLCIMNYPPSWDPEHSLDFICWIDNDWQEIECPI